MTSLRTLVAVVLTGMVSTGCMVEADELDAGEIDSVPYETLEGLPGMNGQTSADGVALWPYMDEIAASKLTTYDAVNHVYVPVNTAAMNAIRSNLQSRKGLKYMLKAAGAADQRFRLCDINNQNCWNFNGEMGLGLAVRPGYVNWVSDVPLSNVMGAALEQQRKLLATWGVYYNLVELPIYIMTEAEPPGNKFRDCTFWSNNRFADLDREIHACSDVYMNSDEVQQRFCGNFADIDCPITYHGACDDINFICELSYPWTKCLGNRDVIISMTYP
jgi:hypothetical protein